MLCATPVLKPGRTRISRISNGITLPRTVEVVSLAAALIGAVLTTLFVLFFTRSMTSIFAALAFGGAAGWLSTTWSPLKGESLAKWLGLKVSRSRNTKVVKGKRVNVFVGVAPVTRVSVGPARIRQSTVDIFPGSRDNDGRLIEDQPSQSSTPRSAASFVKFSKDQK